MRENVLEWYQRITLNQQYVPKEYLLHFLVELGTARLAIELDKLRIASVCLFKAECFMRFPEDGGF